MTSYHVQRLNASSAWLDVFYSYSCDEANVYAREEQLKFGVPVQVLERREFVHSHYPAPDPEPQQIQSNGRREFL